MGLESAILLLFLYSLLLFVLSLLLFLCQPFFLFLDKLIKISLSRLSVSFWLERGEKVIRVFLNEFLYYLSLLLGFLNLTIIKYLLESFMNRYIRILLLQQLLRFLVDLRLLSKLLQLPLCTQQLCPFLQLFPSNSVFKEPLHSCVQYDLGLLQFGIVECLTRFIVERQAWRRVVAVFDWVTVLIVFKCHNKASILIRRGVSFRFSFHLLFLSI